MEKKSLMYEGKAKKLYETDDAEVIWVEYLDQATALNGAKKNAIQGKGSRNNQITSRLFELVQSSGIQSHFIEQLSDTEQVIRLVSMFPLEVVVRNIAAGSFSKRLGVEEGTRLPFPILEFYLKNDKLDDPIINDDHVKVLEIATEDEIMMIKSLSFQVNNALIKIFDEIDIILVDFKLEFGKTSDGEIILADEISPDTCRLWDKETNDHLDKDIYRRDLGDLIPVYDEVLRRLNSLDN